MRLSPYHNSLLVRQTADTPWHGLEGLHESIMDMLEEVDFEGDGDAAHSMLDTGGDIVGAHLFDTSYATEWYSRVTTLV